MQRIFLVFNLFLLFIASGTAQETDGCPNTSCDIVCTNGFQVGSDGCELCSCNPCPPVRCAIFCENGFKIGSDNCSICECNNVADKCTELTCDESCDLYGYRVGNDGCMTCECNDNPCDCDTDEMCMINSKLEWNCVKNPGENKTCAIEDDDTRETSGSKSSSSETSGSKSSSSVASDSKSVSDSETSGSKSSNSETSGSKLSNSETSGSKSANSSEASGSRSNDTTSGSSKSTCQGNAAQNGCGRDSLPEKVLDLLSSISGRAEERAEKRRLRAVNNGAASRDLFQGVETAPDTCQDGFYCRRTADDDGVCSATPKNGPCYVSSTDPDEECDKNGYYKLQICTRIRGTGNKECVCVEPENGTRYEDTKVIIRNNRDSNINCIDRVYGTCSVTNNGIGYLVRHGNDHFDRGNCRRCRCFFGQFYCDESLNVCKNNGTQTSSCTLDDGRSIPHGSSYSLDCNRCFCANGKLICSEFSCGNSESACSRCSSEKFSKVCGPDGRTYPNLCSAVECGGWSAMEVWNGSCSSINACVQHPCDSGEICFRRGGVSCLSESGCLPNERRVCLNIVGLQCNFNTTFLPYERDPADTSEIGTGDIDPADTAVCGSDGVNYPAICHLIPKHARVNVAHAGACDNINCRGGTVCGTDGDSYENICALKTYSANARIDYPGECLDSDMFDSYDDYCRSVVDQGLCQYSETNCEHLVQPAVGCCPICGASVSFIFNGEVLQVAAGIVSSVSTLDNLLASLLPSDLFTAVTESGMCSLEASLTVTGNVEIVFSSIQPENRPFCAMQASAIVQELNSANVGTRKRQTTTERPAVYDLILGAALAPNTTDADGSTGGTVQTSVAVALLYIVVTATIFITYLL